MRRKSRWKKKDNCMTKTAKIPSTQFRLANRDSKTAVIEEVTTSLTRKKKKSGGQTRRDDRKQICSRTNFQVKNVISDVKPISVCIYGNFGIVIRLPPYVWSIFNTLYSFIGRAGEKKQFPIDVCVCIGVILVSSAKICCCCCRCPITVQFEWSSIKFYQCYF